MFREAQAAAKHARVGPIRPNHGPVNHGGNRHADHATQYARRRRLAGRPSNISKAPPRDRQAGLVTCEHDTRRVTRTEFDGTVTVLIDKFDGKPLNSPNDIVVKSDDSIWFSDPPFGILGNYEGHVATPELPTNVYRLDPKTGRATIAAGGIQRPKGRALFPHAAEL